MVIASGLTDAQITALQARDSQRRLELNVPVLTMAGFGMATGGLSRVGVSVLNNQLGYAANWYNIPKVSTAIGNNNMPVVTVTPSIGVTQPPKSTSGVAGWLLIGAIAVGVLAFIRLFK